jgi:hypothetical protein
MGLPELLPESMKGIAIDTSRNYIDVRKLPRPDAEVIRAGSLHLAHWFCNEKADCDSMPDWEDGFEDIKIWNWGNAADISTTGGSAQSAEDGAQQAEGTPHAPGPNRRTPHIIAHYMASLGPDCPWSLPIHESLLTALTFALFEDRFGAPSSTLDFRSSQSKLFNLLNQIANEYMRHIILRLRGENLFKTGRPISHVFLDIIDCVKSIKDLAKKEDPGDEGKERAKFCDSRDEFWKPKLGFYTPSFVKSELMIVRGSKRVVDKCEPGDV